MIPSNDYIYIERVLNGDLAAYTHLVNKYKNMAYTVALKIMRNTEDAEDTTQEAFIKAYQQLHSFEKKSKFSTWLYTIVYRTAIYNARKNQIKTQQINEEVTFEYESYENDFLKTQDHQKYVKHAIDRLSEKEGLLISLFYINENSIAEIKTITGLSESNIKVKLFRARKKLKRELKTLLKHEINTLL